MKESKLLSEYYGYQTKKDITNVDYRFLVTGSQNVLVNAGEKVVSRGGISLLGGEKDSDSKIVSSYDWSNNTGGELNLRCYGEKLQLLNNDVWVDILSSLTSVDFCFAEWWDNTEKIDVLLFCNGTNNLFEWSGGVAVVDSVTSTTITKQGSTSWAENRFYASRDKIILINNIEYAYTGGEGTATLTGVSPSPIGNVSQDDLAIQKVKTSALSVSSTALANFILVHKNQIYVQSKTSRNAYVSKNTNYNDFTWTTAGRLPGEGALLNLDGYGSGMVSHEDAVYLSAGKSYWYQTVFTLSSDNLKEALTVEKLKSGPLQGAITHKLIWKIKNSVVFVSNENVLDQLGRVENINTPQSRPLSDPVKKDFYPLDMTDANGIFYRDQSFITFPKQSLVMIFDHENNYWQPPQRMSISCFSIIKGKLYGHSYSGNESYKIFDENSTDDLGNPINCVAVFSYNNFGRRDWKKDFNEYYIEGYATKSAKINVSYKYDYLGSKGEIENRVIDMSNPAIIFESKEDASLGKNSLAKMPFGSLIAGSPNFPKFRTKQTVPKISFYEFQIIFNTNDIDLKWELLSHGPNAGLSPNDDVSIKT